MLVFSCYVALRGWVRGMLSLFSCNLRSGPIVAVLMHSLLRRPAKILPCLPECYLQREINFKRA